ncbi:MAG: hypothetical protein U0Z26_19325 [Anaerolineales bacterium]
MTGRKSMFLFYFSITLATLSSALYHFSAKSVPSNINFAISLVDLFRCSGGDVNCCASFPRQNGLAFG